MQSSLLNIKSDYFCFSIPNIAQDNSELLLATSGILNSNSGNFKLFVYRVSIEHSDAPMFANSQQVKMRAKVLTANGKVVKKFIAIGSPSQCYQYLANKFEGFLLKRDDNIYLEKHSTPALEELMPTNAVDLENFSNEGLIDIQQQVDRWITSVGVSYFSELTNLSNLIEEVGEVARLIGREYGEQSFKKGEQPDCVKTAIADELCDVLFIVMCLANQLDINLDEAFSKNMNKKTKRDSQRHKNNNKLD